MMTHRTYARCATAFVVFFAIFTAGARAELLSAAWIPTSIFPQGRVRAIARDDGLTLEVLLHSRYLDRLVQAIIEKENANWPEDHPDATAYIEGVLRARAEVKKLTGGRGRETLRISFILQPKGGVIEWTTGALRESRGEWILDTPRPLHTLTPSRAYLVRNAALILQDSLRYSEKDARALVGADEPGAP
jgi:hypothetical protein